MDGGMERGRSAGTTAFDEWMEILRRIGELYGQLTEAELGKRDALRRGDLAALEAASRHERRLLERYEELDAARKERMAAWQLERGLDADPRMTLTAAIAALDDEAGRNALRRMRRDLNEAARRLKAAAETNRDLMQLSLDAAAAMATPGAPVRDDIIYGHPGQGRPAGEQPLGRPSGYDRRM
jgi:hypothetical protein